MKPVASPVEEPVVEEISPVNVNEESAEKEHSLSVEAMPEAVVEESKPSESIYASMTMSQLSTQRKSLQQAIVSLEAQIEEACEAEEFEKADEI